MRVSVTELVDNPGESRRLTRVVKRQDVGSDAPWGPAEGAFEGPLDLDLRLESLLDGILVRGTVGFELRLSCARCLTPVVDEREDPVTELYRDPVRQPDKAEEGYTIDPDQTIDLERMLRDVVVLGVPLRVFCHQDCRGLCATCGADLNHHDCGHDRSSGIDPRWAPLLDLTVPER